MTETTLSADWGFRGKLLNVEVLQVALASGRRSVREVVRHPGAAVILARRADGCFLFVRQFRKALEREMLEVVAGTLSPGELPEACARREVREETGYRALTLLALGVVTPAPGYTDERLHVFFAEVEPDPERLAPDEDEVLLVEPLTAAQIGDLIARGAIEDAKTLAAWLLFMARGV